MFTATKTEPADASTADVFSKKQSIFFGYHHKSALQEEKEEDALYYANVLQASENTVVNAEGVLGPSASSPATHPKSDWRHLIMARAATALAGLLSILSIVLSGVAMAFRHRDLKKNDVYEDMMPGICMILNGIVIAECFFCVIAMAACFGLLFTRPHAVLIRSRRNHGLNCLRASIMLLFFFATYSVVVSIVCAALYANTAVFVVACISAVVRCVALICFFVLLGNNSKVHPLDPFY